MSIEGARQANDDRWRREVVGLLSRIADSLDDAEHKDGRRSVLRERKADDSGWWLEDHGGLVDSVWNDHGYTDWTVLGMPCPACGGTGIESPPGRGGSDAH